MSIRNILVSAFFIVSFVLAVMVGDSTYRAFRQFQSSDRVEMLARYDKALFTALLSFRSGRGDSATALTLPSEKAAASIASFKAMRAKVQAAMAGAETLAANFEDADLKKAAADLKAVNGGSGEISSASDNLAERTEQQAASLEETAAALEEITANVKMTSRHTVEARDLVYDARGKADHSGVVVDNAVKAMQHQPDHQRD